MFQIAKRRSPYCAFLGYRLRQDCGTSGTFLVTADPERAFLTIDSGFPLPEVEATLQGGKTLHLPVRCFSSGGALHRERLDFSEQTKRQRHQRSSRRSFYAIPLWPVFIGPWLG